MTTATILEVMGTVRPDGTLELDHKLDLEPGRVRVRVEQTQSLTTGDQLLDRIAQSHREREAAGHRFMTDEELTAWIEELREDDERMEAIYRDVESRRWPKEGME